MEKNVKTNPKAYLRISNFKMQILDTYFLTRHPKPEEGSVQQRCTTLNIQEDLEPMMHLSGEDIIDYMLEHGYGTTTEEDGTVAWAVFREIPERNRDFPLDDKE